MRFSRVLRNFLIGYSILHLIVAAVFLFVLSAWLRDQMLSQTRHRMLDLSYSLRQHISELDDGMSERNLLTHIQQLEKETDARFTLIRQDGKVLVDSRTGYQEIGDHGNRPEILQAAEDGVGFDQRTSATLNLPLLYLAIPIFEEAAAEPTGFVRVAVEANTVYETIVSLQNFLWLFTLGSGLIAGFLMVLFASREMSPLQGFTEAARSVAAGKHATIPSIGRRKNDEWKSLAEAFTSMQSELEQREANLGENSSRLQAVLGSMVEGVCAIDSSRIVRVANEAACRMLRVEKEGLVGFGLFDVVRSPELMKAVQHSLLTQSATETEFEMDGTPRSVLNVRVSPLTNERDFGVAIVMHDVTDLRNLETMRRDFVANVSHELKTPLASIKAFAETLRLGAIDDKDNNVAFVKEIETQAEVLDDQIRDLLKLSEIESGGVAFEMTNLSLKKTFQKCAERFRVEADRREIYFQIETPEDEGIICTDRRALDSILDNLVSNALRYARPSGFVALSAERNDDHMIISVADNGIGISKEHQERIFERFYRVDKARSRELGGTGLGLAIVKHTVNALGGTIDVQSKVGQGSAFTIRLPSKNKDEVAADSPGGE